MNARVGHVLCEPHLYYQVRGWYLRRLRKVPVCHRVMTKSAFAFRGRTFERLDGWAQTCSGLVEIPSDVSRSSPRAPARGVVSHA